MKRQIMNTPTYIWTKISRKEGYGSRTGKGMNLM